MISYFLSDVGRVRSNNQDSINIIENESGEILLIVADGMGGHNAGEIASSLVVNYFTEEWSKYPGFESKEELFDWLDDQTYLVNELVYNYSEDHPECKGMGTTLVMAAIIQDGIIFCNVGDSRGYVIKENNLIQVTTDHTLVSALVQTGEITLEEAMTHPKKNVLMRAIGTNPTVEADIFEVMEHQINSILLCSDGLTNMISEIEIEKIVNGNVSVEEKVITLVEIANAKGGLDNISVAYLDMSGDQ